MQRDNWGKWATIFALLIIIIAGVWMIRNVSDRRTTVSVGSTTVRATVVDTEESRQKGLSGTRSLGDNEGMLFVFEAPGRWGMWMKDMKYNLDLIWADENKKIVHIEQNIAPDTYPKSFLPVDEALYVLEVPSGFVAKHGVQVGQILAFSEY